MPEEVTHHCIVCFTERPPEELEGGMCPECRSNQPKPNPEDDDLRTFMYGL